MFTYFPAKETDLTNVSFIDHYLFTNTYLLIRIKNYVFALITYL